MDSEKLELVKKHIKAYPNFPKKGVIFRDIFSIMLNTHAFTTLIELLKQRIDGQAPPKGIVGLDSRGFLFGPILATHFSVPFLPIRKKGKLPGQVVSIDYALEYGEASCEAQLESFSNIESVIIVDDLLATGGTLKAACDLMNTLKVEVIQCLVVMEITELKGREKLTAKVNSLIKY